MRMRTVEVATTIAASSEALLVKVLLLILHLSLRQRYLDQVQRVNGETTILSAGLTPAPLLPYNSSSLEPPLPYKN